MYYIRNCFYTMILFVINYFKLGVEYTLYIYSISYAIRFYIFSSPFKKKKKIDIYTQEWILRPLMISNIIFVTMRKKKIKKKNALIKISTIVYICVCERIIHNVKKLLIKITFSVRIKTFSCISKSHETPNTGAHKSIFFQCTYAAVMSSKSEWMKNNDILKRVSRMV